MSSQPDDLSALHLEIQQLRASLSRARQSAALMAYLFAIVCLHSVLKTQNASKLIEQLAGFAMIAGSGLFAWWVYRVSARP